ncbi:hypothetical protein Ssi03_62850 [Sphaerisporangium siamense]|uniref:Uncharacterized protein n=1 Tax=Sphaerisporangium siamense TaxID=795645 RepID=A0A7W7G993_9ACTN|nr:hypothetical protein [Sphaerisporangium siamense]MBB4702593.1 hypothetical protein [Sphaerisporangium siamense]GII88295.1 hypothetical protein Ssi03_62850 [Sphaerisporangium siamense]
MEHLTGGDIAALTIAFLFTAGCLALAWVAHRDNPHDPDEDPDRLDW